MDTKKLLSDFLDEEDYVNLGTAVVTGYKACNSFMESNKVLSNFIVGMEQRSRLISVFVEHSLTNLDGFTSEIKPNAAKNCHHARIYKNKFAITAHFLGRGKTPRKMPNSALNRAVLSDRNMSLFPDEDTTPDLSNVDMGYGWLLHSGFITPRDMSLAIPTRDQKNIFALTPLPMAEVKQSDVEQVHEEMVIKLITDNKVVVGNAS